MKEKIKSQHDKLCEEFEKRHIKKLDLESMKKKKQKKEENELKKSTMVKLMSNQ